MSRTTTGAMARALAAAMIGEQATAEEEVRRGLRHDPSSTAMWEVLALLGRHYGTDDGQLERVADATRGRWVWIHRSRRR